MNALLAAVIGTCCVIAGCLGAVACFARRDERGFDDRMIIRDEREDYHEDDCDQ